MGSMLMPSDIVDEVESVLLAAAPGKGEHPHFMTAYQILARMNEVRRLQRERGVPGARSGVHYSAASVVEQACQMLSRKGIVETEYLVTAGLSFDVTDHPPVRAGNAICGIYRVKRP